MKWTRAHTTVLVVITLLIALAVLYWKLRLPKLDQAPVPWSAPLVERDLDVIKGDTLRLLVMQDPLTWEQRPKVESGLEYELIERFAREQGIPVKVNVAAHRDSLFLWLQQGRADVLVAQLAPRSKEKAWVRFTKPYRQVRPMVARLRTDPLRDVPGAPAVDAPLDSVLLSPWSPFADASYQFEKGAARFVVPHAEPALTPEELLVEVVLGRHRATVVSDARAAYMPEVFPVLEFDGPVGPAQPQCFAVRRNAPRLSKALDTWLGDPDEQAAQAQLAKAYGTAMPRGGPLRTKRGVPVVGDSISPYDNWFRQHADGMAWDWELLAVMAYKESRFDSTVTSRKGAMGIMQLMPRTAARLGLDSSHAMDDHIRAAVRYLSKLDTLWMRAVPDREQRLRFVLASYNAGPGHIIDAQRLAEQLGLDPERWEHNVERTILLKAMPAYYMRPEMRNGYCKGSQVFHYVRDVVGMYVQLKARRGSSNKRSSKGKAGKAGV
ncbi:MAG: transglycosylase SLT domain-containing protein [Flavobacteriales bacterium]|nr:transglycosylase SLT domain-containing protein [Flavobacteriales bacterium]